MSCCHPTTKREMKLRNYGIAIAIGSLAVVFIMTGVLLLFLAFSYYSGSIVTTFSVSGSLFLISGALWMISGCIGFHTLLRKPGERGDEDESDEEKSEAIPPPPPSHLLERDLSSLRPWKNRRSVKRQKSVLTIFDSQDNEVPQNTLPPITSYEHEDTEASIKKKKKKKKKHKKKNRIETITTTENEEVPVSSRVKTLMSLYDEPEFHRKFPQEDIRRAQQPKTLYITSRDQ